MTLLDTGEERIIDIALASQKDSVESAKHEFSERTRAFIRDHPAVTVGVGVAAIGALILSRRAPSIGSIVKVPTRMLTGSVIGALLSTSE